jgi:hypothetical protein
MTCERPAAPPFLFQIGLSKLCQIPLDADPAAARFLSSVPPGSWKHLLIGPVSFGLYALSGHGQVFKTSPDGSLKATIDLGVSVAHASIQSTSVSGELLLVSDRRTSSICAFHLGASPQKLSACDARQLQEIVCFNVDATGQWMVAGSIDGALAVWRLHSGGTPILLAP